MAKHALPHKVQREIRRARLRQSLPIAVPVFLGAAVLESADVPEYVRPFLVVFGAVVPLLLIDAAAKVLARIVAERRARRGANPRPRMTYLAMALAWLLAGTGFVLLTWATRAMSSGPGAGANAAPIELDWATVISICATLMMALRAATLRAATLRAATLSAATVSARLRAAR